MKTYIFLFLFKIEFEYLLKILEIEFLLREIRIKDKYSNKYIYKKEEFYLA